MNNQKPNFASILASFSVGQGKTSDMVDLVNYVNDNDSVTLTYAEQQAIVSEEWVKAKFLSYIHTDMKDKPIQTQKKLFEAFQEGRLSLNHRFDSQIKETKVIAGHYLTSEQYIENCAAMNNLDTLALYYSVESLSKDATKEVLWTFIKHLKQSLITEDQYNTYVTLKVKEENLDLAIKSLINVGLVDAKIKSETEITGHVPLANSASFSTDLKTLNYELVKTDLDMQNMRINVVVKI